MKTRIPIASLVLAAALAVAAVPAVAQPRAENPAKTFHEAKVQEEAKGAMDRAIALYREVWQNPAALMSLRAQALYREGLCQVRKDDFAAARAAFERLVREYPRSQPTAHAKLMLKTLGASEKGMAAARDISVEVKDQLIHGAKGNKEAHAALKTLVFYGRAAIPALREALVVQDRAVYMLALHALARIGDLRVMDDLLRAAGTEWFRQRSRNVFYLTESGALASLCKAHKAALPRVAAAYREADGLTKANLMRVLLDLKREDRITDYKRYLASDDEDLRAAAWYVHSRLALGENGKAGAFLADLLKAWNAHPDRRSELSGYLFKTGRLAVERDPELAGPWQKTLLAAAASEDERIVQEVARGLRHLDLGHQLPIRTALLASPDRRVREQAASLRRNPSEPRPELDPAQLTAFANALVDAAAKHHAREQQHSAKLLNALVQNVVPLLDPAAYRALADRLFTPPVSEVFRVDGPPNQQGVLGSTALQIFHLSGIQGAYTNHDRAFSLAEKYVPVLAAYAAPGQPRAVRLRCFQNLGQIVRQAWSFLPPAEQKRVKQTYFVAFDEYRAGKLSQNFTQQLKVYLYNGLIQLAQQRPRVMTVDELLRHAPLGTGVVSGAVYGKNLFDAYSPQELREGFLRGARAKEVRPEALLKLLDHVEIEPAARDAALRQLWARAGAARVRIVMQLSESDANLKLLIGAIEPAMSGALAQAILRRLETWPSRAAAPGLIRLLGVQSDKVKVKACQALGSLADARAVPELIELLAYHDGEVRRAAEEALTAIRNIDKKQAEWREWYERHGKRGIRKAPEKKSD